MIMSEELIRSLVADHSQVKPFNPKIGTIFTVISTAAAILACHMMYGIRADVLAASPGPDMVIKSGLLFFLGLSAFYSTLAMARPGIGKNTNSWLWVALVAAIFPAYTLFLAVSDQFPSWVLYARTGIQCFITSCAIGIFIASGLIAWLRTAAPVRLERIGWSVGVASGSFATMAYSFTCPNNGMAYAGVWYTLAILTTSIACRFAVPRILKW
jgi:hypothetical protein